MCQPAGAGGPHRADGTADAPGGGHEQCLGQGRIIPLQTGASNGDRTVLQDRVEPGQAVERRVPGGPLRRGRPAQSAEPPVHVRQPQAQERKHLRAEPGAEVLGIAVGRVIPVRQPGGPGVVPKLGAGERQQRPHQHSGGVRHSGEPGRPAPLKRPHQDGFGLIVGMVAEEDPVGLEAPGGVDEPATTRLTRRGLGRGRTEGECRRLADEPVRRGDIADPRGDVSAPRGDAVVQVRDDQLLTVLAGAADQQVEEHQRVGAAGDGHERASRRQRQAQEVRPEAVEEFHRDEV